MDSARADEVATHGGWSCAEPVEIAGDDPVLPTPWPVGDVAAVALSQVGAAAAHLSRLAGGDPGPTRVEVAAAASATISFALLTVDGQSMMRTNTDNPWVGRYRCSDQRWIHLHGGFPALAARLAALLGIPADSGETVIAAAVARWQSSDLEETIADRRGCAAIIRTTDEWCTHPQGSQVDSWPTVVARPSSVPFTSHWLPSAHRPLEGLRVLDLTRVLAGPTCGRTLAAFGADVLHVRGPDVPFVPAFVVDTGHGKRQAHCDFGDPDQLARLRRVAGDADVIVQGYRPGVVARVGLDEASLRLDGFGGLYGSVSAYGHDGPWSDRAGWEQLAQSTSGLCLDPLGDDKPAMLPCAATDYTTGLALAAGLMHALGGAVVDGCARRVDASLCQTAAWIVRTGQLAGDKTATGFTPDLLRTDSGFGVVEHLGPCVNVDGLDIGWKRPTAPLGAGTLSWDR